MLVVAADEVQVEATEDEARVEIEGEALREVLPVSTEEEVAAGSIEEEVEDSTEAEVLVAAEDLEVLANPEGMLLHIGSGMLTTLNIDIAVPRVFMAGQPANFDARLAGKDQDDLVSSFKSLTLKHEDMPARPGWGTVGTPIKLRANYFPVKLPRGPLYEYDIKITPEAKARRLKKQIFALLEERPEYAAYKPRIAHDSSAKMIAAMELPQPLVIEVPYYDEDEEGPRQGGTTYSIEITYIQPLELATLEKCVAHFVLNSV